MRWLLALNLIFFSPTVFASLEIENPSAAVLRENSDALKRVLELSSDRAQCSGTWIEKGVILTAAHCLELTQQKGFRVQRVEISVLGTAHRESLNESDKLSEDLSTDFFTSLQDANDYGLIFVDSEKLKQLNLPDEPIEMAKADGAELTPGTSLLISGYGNQKIRPGPGQLHGGKKTAAIIQTISPHSDDVYSIISSARRKFQVTATIARGKTSQDAQFSIDFSSKKRDGSLTLPGDSGGPAFVMEEGQWKLVGLASLIRMMPDLGRQFQMSLRFGQRQYEKTMKLEQAPIAGIGDFQDYFLEMLKTFNRETVQVDWSKPLMDSLVYRQTAEGEVRSYHVSLKDPMIRALIQRSIKKFQLGRPEVESE